MKKILIIMCMIFPFSWCISPRGGARDDGLLEVTFEHKGRTRSFLLHVPKTVPLSKSPLLIVLHGGGGSPDKMLKLTKGRFNELADSQGFFVAYPAGLEHGWNDFRNDKINFSHRENIDDAGFIAALIDRLAGTYPVDRSRVFVTGISNGGFMSYRLACELSGTIQGIAAVAATHPVDQAGKCAPSAPLNVLIMNGTEDPLVPYEGGEVTVFKQKRGKILSTDDSVKFWVSHNKCPASPAIFEMPDKDPGDKTRVRKITYGPCAGGTRVVLYRVEGGGHAWPGGLHYLFTKIIGVTSRDINACDEIWNFFNNR